MLLVLIGSLVLMGMAFALLAKAAGMSRARTAETLAQIDAYGFTVPTATDAGTGARGIVDAVATLLGQAFASRLSGLKESEIRRELMAAGLYGLTPKRYIGYRVISFVTVPVAMLWLAVLT